MKRTIQNERLPAVYPPYATCSSLLPPTGGTGCWAFPAFLALAAGAQANAATAPLVAPALPDAGVSFLRVMGALALVIGMFLGAVWLFKNYQRLALARGRAPKLRVLESRSLGGRHALFVIAYDQERFLIASSPGGVNLLSHLPPFAEGEAAANAGMSAPASFPQALAQVLKSK